MNDRFEDNAENSLGSVMKRTTDPMYGPVIERGAGSRVWDTQGQQYFDLTCGYSAANFGHAFAPLVNAATTQLNRLTHLTGIAHPGRAQLADLLVEHCGRSGDQVIFNTSGSRAVETAIKVALANKPGRIVSIGAAYHGRSLFTAALSDTASIHHMSSNHALSASCVRRPMSEMAYCAHCPLGLNYPTCRVACVNSFLEWIEHEHANISAVIAEPAYGARGYIAPPIEYWQRVREVTARRGILMIADEIQMGLGRCGHWLLSRAQGWQADLVVLGKSLGGGITSISAVIGQRTLLDHLPPGSESETFAASPLATAVGIEVVQQLRDGPWLARAAELGQRLAGGLKKFDCRIETLGASATLEFLAPGCEPQTAANAARGLAVRMRQAGLLVHYSGPLATRIVLLPPLTISEPDIGEILHILSQLS